MCRISTSLSLTAGGAPAPYDPNARHWISHPATSPAVPATAGPTATMAAARSLTRLTRLVWLGNADVFLTRTSWTDRLTVTCRTPSCCMLTTATGFLLRRIDSHGSMITLFGPPRRRAGGPGLNAPSKSCRGCPRSHLGTGDAATAHCRNAEDALIPRRHRRRILCPNGHAVDR
jgi:hypothetical protein